MTGAVCWGFAKIGWEDEELIGASLSAEQVMFFQCGLYDICPAFPFHMPHLVQMAFNGIAVLNSRCDG